jgi:hypothetical protein
MIGYPGTGSDSGREIKNDFNISGHSPVLSLFILTSWRKLMLLT